MRKNIITHILLFRNEEGCLLPHFWKQCSQKYRMTLKYLNISRPSAPRTGTAPHVSRQAWRTPWWRSPAWPPTSPRGSTQTVSFAPDSGGSFLLRAPQLMGFACRFNSFFMLKGKLEWILLTLHCQPARQQPLLGASLIYIHILRYWISLAGLRWLKSQKNTRTAKLRVESKEIDFKHNSTYWIQIKFAYFR